MKKLILITLTLMICCSAQAKVYMNDDIPAPNSYHVTGYGNTYHSSTGTTYRKYDTHIYGSDGSAYNYNRNSDTVQNLYNGKVYQRSGENLWHQVN